MGNEHLQARGATAAQQTLNLEVGGSSPPVPAKTWDEYYKIIFENQTAILEWLKSLGHEIDDDNDRHRRT